ncbi:MAG TPA: NUDIX domain-containing protein [Thermomicrobiales bacterium]|jgi:isopentenyldiphosphate isomerase|nr:NUDIX domain-containing protein [Thermomicrobiales bacterium]
MVTPVPDDILAAQDPGELFDVYRADGQPAGRTKRRADVHRDGDWHRAIHIWVIGHDDEVGPFLLMQRRSLAKDTWPGVLDVTVGGHYRAGESLIETLREAEEEIGVTVAMGDLVPLGIRVAVNERPEEGIFDHELQDVFLYRDDRPLTGYRPHPAELAELIRIPLDALIEFERGGPGPIAVQRITPGETTPMAGTIGPADFVPTVDRYVMRVAYAVRRVLAGERDVLI